MEVQFKNTRKGYYVNSLNLPVEKGDMVAVESSPGHDVGCVTLTGPLVLLQMKKGRVETRYGIETPFRMAKPADIEKFEEARAREEENYDPCAPDCRRAWFENENRRCGISG